MSLYLQKRFWERSGGFSPIAARLPVGKTALGLIVARLKGKIRVKFKGV